LPSVIEFLNHTIEIPKVIITNGQREGQAKKIQATALDAHVLGFVTPSDCGHWKPSAVIFEAALGLLGLPASECLMIGDDLLRDIEPARKLGMRCFHIRPGGNLLEAIDCA
jgi:putative hydrolase of the HAD superfamily